MTQGGIYKQRVLMGPRSRYEVLPATSPNRQLSSNVPKKTEVTKCMQVRHSSTLQICSVSK